VLAKVPTQREAALVALAWIGGMPVNSRVGKTISPPPAATPLTVPARRATLKRRKDENWGWVGSNMD
jgi:hypothetical protein